MIILNSERPQGVHYTDGVLDLGDPIMYNVSDCKFCLKCKFSERNMSYPKDELDCSETKAICNAFCTCDKFEEDC